MGKKNRMKTFSRRDMRFIACTGLLIFAGLGAVWAADESASSMTDRQVRHTFSGLPWPEPSFPLADPGEEGPIDYARYGHFENAGTEQYQYYIDDLEGLKAAVGEGIYPNARAVTQNPLYQRMEAQGLLSMDHWKALNGTDPQQAFYIWSQVPEEPGVNALFTAHTLERSGHIRHALKAYQAALIHFPQSVCWAADKSFVWYIGSAAIANIERLCRDYPQLECELSGARMDIQNGYDPNLDDDVIAVEPGQLIHKTLQEKLAQLPDLSQMEIVERRGKGKVQLVKFANGHWQMLVDGNPLVVKAVTYGATRVGTGPHTDPIYYTRWMREDTNQNGIIDSPYEAWVDANGNGQQDKDEPPVGDFRLMQDMGVNAVRVFLPNNPIDAYDPSLVNKPLLREMAEKYGIYLIAGDSLGAYTVGSGASWEEGTDYRDPEQRRKMKEVVRAKVMDLKDEPFVLMWVLGNENNMNADYLGHNATRTNAAVHPQAYAEFLNEAAEMIHELDPDHPVAVGNVELGLAEYYRRYAPAIDIFGINSYRGLAGFGDLWLEAQKQFDRPILITEFGSDAYFTDKGEDEDQQMVYFRGNWRDIAFHLAGGPSTGNAVGGVVFEYVDEWWKDAFGDPEDRHNPAAQFSMPFADGMENSEWYGIVSQGTGQHSPFERRLRKAYYYFKDTWTHE